MPLYRTADVEALPGLYAARPITRAALVRGFAADLAAGLGTEITARYDPGRDTWELHWQPGPGGQPDKRAIRAAPHAASITLHPAAAETPPR